MEGRAGQRSCLHRTRRAQEQKRRRPRRFLRRSCTQPLSGGCGLHTTKWSGASLPPVSPSCQISLRHRRDSWRDLLLLSCSMFMRGRQYTTSQHPLPEVLLQRHPTPATAGTVNLWLSGCSARQGACFARHPWRTIGVAALIMAVLALGLLRFRVESDPQRLWVGPSSRAAKEKVAYEV